MMLPKQYKSCHVCGGETYRITSDDTVICADCGTLVGYYKMEK